MPSSSGTVQADIPAAIWPNCDLAYPIEGETGNLATGVVVDAALVAHSGSLATQNYAAGPSANWAFYLNGADVSDYRGSFGSGSIGYSKQFSYDTRLAFVEPPDLLASSVSVWKDLGYVECRNANTASQASPTCLSAP